MTIYMPSCGEGLLKFLPQVIAHPDRRQKRKWRMGGVGIRLSVPFFGHTQNLLAIIVHWWRPGKVCFSRVMLVIGITVRQEQRCLVSHSCPGIQFSKKGS